MAIVEELKLRSTVVIDGTSIPIEIVTMLDGDIIAYNIGGRIYSTKPLKKNDEEKEEDDPPPKVEYTKELNRQKMAIRAPNNTLLFVNWLREMRYTEFDIKQFIKKYPNVTKDNMEKIIAYQIVQGNLLQLSNTRFKIAKK